MTKPDKDGWIAWTGGDCPFPTAPEITVRTREDPEISYRVENPAEMEWAHGGGPDDIVAYRLERPRESLHVQPEPDGFTHESPIRAFTDWRVNGRYAIGKGFRPSLAHLTVYLDAMERLEGWEMRQILEAASGSPSFVFRRKDEQ